MIAFSHFRKNDYVRTEFEPTLKMSSYLVGLVVSDFRCISGVADNAGPSGNLPIKVCARPNIPGDQLKYALDIGIRVIEFYEKLYDIKYPLPKCGRFIIKEIITKLILYSIFF